MIELNINLPMFNISVSQRKNVVFVSAIIIGVYLPSMYVFTCTELDKNNYKHAKLQDSSMRNSN